MSSAEQRGRSRSRSGTISPAPPPTAKRLSRNYTQSPSPERKVKPRMDDSAHGDRTPPRARSRERERSRTPPRPSAQGDDRWAGGAQMNSANANAGAPRARSLSPLRRTRAQSPPGEPQFSYILPLPHSRIPSLLIGLKGTSARNMQTFAGLNRLTFRGAGTGKGSNGNDPPICELRGSRRAIEDGLWAIQRKASSHNQRIDTSFREDALLRVGGGGGGPPPPPQRRDEGRQGPPPRDGDRDRGMDRPPPTRRDDPYAMADRNGRDPPRDAPRDAPRREEERPVARGPASFGTSDFSLEIPSLSLSSLYSHLPKLRSTAGVEKITLKQGASSFIYIWGAQSGIDSVMSRVDELIQGVYPSWRDAASRAQGRSGWDREQQPVRVEIARPGPLPDRNRRERSPPRHRSPPPPSARGQERGTTPPRRQAPPQRERQASPDPVAIGRYVAGLSEDRRDAWTAEFVRASGLPHAEIKDEDRMRD